MASNPSLEEIFTQHVIIENGLIYKTYFKPNKSNINILKPGRTVDQKSVYNFITSIKDNIRLEINYIRNNKKNIYVHELINSQLFEKLISDIDKYVIEKKSTITSTFSTFNIDDNLVRIFHLLNYLILIIQYVKKYNEIKGDEYDTVLYKTVFDKLKNEFLFPIFNNATSPPHTYNTILSQLIDNTKFNTISSPTYHNSKTYDAIFKECQTAIQGMISGRKTNHIFIEYKYSDYFANDKIFMNINSIMNQAEEYTYINNTLLPNFMKRNNIIHINQNLQSNITDIITKYSIFTSLNTSLSNDLKLYFIHLLNVYKYIKLLNDFIRIHNNNPTIKKYIKDKITTLSNMIIRKSDTKVYINNKGSEVEYSNTGIAESEIRAVFEIEYEKLNNELYLIIGLLEYPEIGQYLNLEKIPQYTSLKRVPLFENLFGYQTYDNLFINFKPTNEDIYYFYNTIKFFLGSNSIQENNKNPNGIITNILISNYITILTNAYQAYKNNTITKDKYEEIKKMNDKLHITDTIFKFNKFNNRIKQYNISNSININYQNEYLKIYNEITGGSMNTIMNYSNSTQINSAIDQLIVLFRRLSQKEKNKIENITFIIDFLTRIKNNTFPYDINGFFNIFKYIETEMRKKVNPIKSNNPVNYTGSISEIFNSVKPLLNTFINITFKNKNGKSETVNIFEYRDYSIFSSNSFSTRIPFKTTSFYNIQNIMSQFYGQFNKAKNIIEYNQLLGKNQDLKNKFISLKYDSNYFQKVFNKFSTNIKNKSKYEITKTYSVFKRLVILYLLLHLIHFIFGFKFPYLLNKNNKEKVATTSEKVASSNNNYSLAKSMISSQNQSLEKNKEARAYIHALLSVVNDLIPKITRRQIPALVNETKKEINKLLVNKKIRVSNKELSSIVNEILIETPKKV